MSAQLGWTRAATLDAALARLAEDPALVPFAGGTDLMVTLKVDPPRQDRFLDLWNLHELRGIDVRPGETVFGALTTYSELVAHRAVAERHPLIGQAARVSGAWAIQNRGTLGGNIANASPAADSPPALLAYRARLELRSVRGVRWIDYAHFHLGYRQTARAADELITRIALPALPPGPVVQLYRKVGPRRAQAISKVCLAGVAALRDGRLADVRLALGAVAPTVVLASRTARILEGRAPDERAVGEARAALESEIAPLDDVRSNAWYRRRVAGNLLEQFLEEATRLC